LRLRVGKKRSASSKRWLAEHEADPYVQRARAEGWRSRAVYKLAELDERDGLLRAGSTIVDLGAAPGGWSQYVRRRLGDRARIFALDILDIEPIEGVHFIQGDFREESVLQEFEALLGNAEVDLVLSDMAPNLSGVDVADQVGSVHLAELALMFARERLRPGGNFLTKVFQGEGFDAYLKEVRESFDKVMIRKPKASRPRSREVYLFGKSHRS